MSLLASSSIWGDGFIRSSLQPAQGSGSLINWLFIVPFCLWFREITELIGTMSCSARIELGLLRQRILSSYWPVPMWSSPRSMFCIWRSRSRLSLQSMLPSGRSSFLLSLSSPYSVKQDRIWKILQFFFHVIRQHLILTLIRSLIIGLRFSPLKWTVSRGLT